MLDERQTMVEPENSVVIGVLSEDDISGLEGDHLTPEELAARWRTSESYLANRRWKKLGPPYLKVGAKVLYPIDSLLAYEKTHLQQGEDKAKSGDDEKTDL